MKTCSASIVAIINGQAVPLAAHCAHQLGHAGDHGTTLSWPSDAQYGIVLDVTVELKR